MVSTWPPLGLVWPIMDWVSNSTTLMLPFFHWRTDILKALMRSTWYWKSAIISSTLWYGSFCGWLAMECQVVKGFFDTSLKPCTERVGRQEIPPTPNNPKHSKEETCSLACWYQGSHRQLTPLPTQWRYFLHYARLGPNKDRIREMTLLAD